MYLDSGDSGTLHTLAQPPDVPTPFSPARIFEYSLLHAIVHIQLSPIRFGICFRILLHRVKGIST